MSNEPVKKEEIVDARRRYYVHDVIDAVESGDLAVIVDAARLYPALVVSLIAEPVLLFRSLYGHKKARRAEMMLKNLFYLSRRTAVEKLLGRPEPVGELGNEPGPVLDDEARRLLEAIQREDANE